MSRPSSFLFQLCPGLEGPALQIAQKNGFEKGRVYLAEHYHPASYQLMIAPSPGAKSFWVPAEYFEPLDDARLDWARNVAERATIVAPRPGSIEASRWLNKELAEALEQKRNKIERPEKGKVV